jgi:Ca2+-binding RTX toxin-like protein
MASAGPGDTIQLEAGYSNETATVTHNGITVFGTASSLGIQLQLAPGIATFTLTGNAPINIRDAADGNGIVGNAGNNRITVTGGVDAVDGGLGIDRLIVDYRLATGAVTGDSTSNFTEAGGGGRSVTVTNGTIEHFTVLTGSGADTITTGSGNDIIKTGHGASTVSAGQGANTIIGGRNADTITALDGGNFINAGNGTNTITSGGGVDIIRSGNGADTIVSGGGNDRIALRGGADTADAGAGNDRLIIDYSAMTTDVTGGITGGNLGTGYVGHIADLAGSSIDFVGSENFRITTGSGNDNIRTGGGADVLSGGVGNDLLKSGAGNDIVGGGAGNDKLFGGTGNDRVYGASGSDLLGGGDGHDRLFGGGWSDRVYGGDGNDTLHGDGGNDRLVGGIGADVLWGGAGADSFIFRNVSESPSGPAKDRARDFSSAQGDQIALNQIDADTTLDGNQAFTFVGSAGFTGAAGELRFVSRAGNGFLAGDVDGDGNADITIFLSGVTSLDAGDLIV